MADLVKQVAAALTATKEGREFVAKLSTQQQAEFDARVAQWLEEYRALSRQIAKEGPKLDAQLAAAQEEVRRAEVQLREKRAQLAQVQWINPVRELSEKRDQIIRHARRDPHPELQLFAEAVLALIERLRTTNGVDWAHDPSGPKGPQHGTPGDSLIAAVLVYRTLQSEEELLLLPTAALRARLEELRNSIPAYTRNEPFQRGTAPQRFVRE